MTFGRHCADLICAKYQLPADVPLALAGIIDREMRLYAEKLSGKPALEPGTNIPPPYDELAEYIKSIGAHFTSEAFLAHYKSNGWKVGRNKMVNWHAACDSWKANDAKQLGLPGMPARRRTAFDIQTRLDFCKKKLNELCYSPAGNLIRLEGDALKKAAELRASIKQLEDELARA